MTNKTEAPTPKRLSEARKKGQIPLSQEINGAVSLLIGTWIITSSGEKLLSGIQNIVTRTLTSLPTVAERGSLPFNNLAPDVMQLASSLSTIILALFATGVIVTMVQTRMNVSTEKLKADLSRLNPLSGIKRILSISGMMEMAKSVVKLIVVAWVVYAFLRTRIQELLDLSQMALLPALQWWAEMARSLAVRVGVAYFVLAVLDYAFQYWNFMRTMKMSKEEVKDEHKQREGSPEIKSRIRSQQRRMAMMRMMSKVPQADVVITNPTHLAIAVQYNQDSMQAPRVLAKGEHLVAERIVTLARDNDIPVVQNITLARALYSNVEVDQEIPLDLYMTMAEVLAYVYGMQGRKFKPETA